MKRDFFSLTRDQLALILKEACGLPSYRAAQVFDWVYRKHLEDFDEMTNVKRDHREVFESLFKFPKAVLVDKLRSEDGSVKLLLEVAPDKLAESVLIQQPGRVTLCLSSQYGCAMGCRFCRTANLGMLGQLSTGDIVRQVLAVQNLSTDGEVPFENIVFMGMGEPLNNYEAVEGACKILMDNQAFNLGPRKITISTVGLIPEIKKIGDSGLGVNLAVSLNATTDEVRSKLMPVNKRYPLAVLLDTLRHYPLTPRRRITIEYVLIAGVNDSEADLRRLPKLLAGVKSKINLIPYNSASEAAFDTPSEEKLLSWHRFLLGRGLPTTIRYSKGEDIAAACGQLGASAARQAEPNTEG